MNNAACNPTKKAEPDNRPATPRTRRPASNNPRPADRAQCQLFHNLTHNTQHRQHLIAKHLHAIGLYDGLYSQLLEQIHYGITNSSKTGYTWDSAKALAEKFCTDVDRVVRALRRLHDAGLIHWVREQVGSGGSVRHFYLLPKALDWLAATITWLAAQVDNLKAKLSRPPRQLLLAPTPIDKAPVSAPKEKALEAEAEKPVNDVPEAKSQGKNPLQQIRDVFMSGVEFMKLHNRSSADPHPKAKRTWPKANSSAPAPTAPTPAPQAKADEPPAPPMSYDDELAAINARAARMAPPPPVRTVAEQPINPGHWHTPSADTAPRRAYGQAPGHRPLPQANPGQVMHQAEQRPDKDRDAGALARLSAQLRQRGGSAPTLAEQPPRSRMHAQGEPSPADDPGYDPDDLTDLMFR